MPAAITRVFMNGNSQAVRIPQEFRLDAREVQISRNDAGDLVIRPLPVDRGAAFLRALEGFDEAMTEDLVRDQPVVQERDEL